MATGTCTCTVLLDTGSNHDTHLPKLHETLKGDGTFKLMISMFYMKDLNKP